MSSVVLDRLEKKYGAATVVQSTSLVIEDGELIAVLGPSGCGKTTTLRMIAGFVEPSSGHVLFGDRDITPVPPRLRNVGIVFQGYALFPHLTVFQNIAFGLQMRKATAGDIAMRVQDILKSVRLEQFQHRLPRELSGGQQQRVALARALVVRPDVVLLDEPLSALDAKLRNEVRDEIRRLQKQFRLTTIVVTHDQDEALSIADRVIVMNHGRIEQIGTPREIFERPATRFTAEFMGCPNFFEGQVAGRHSFLTRSGTKLSIACQEMEAGQTVLAVRPECITLTVERDENSPDLNQLTGSIVAATFRGVVMHYEVDIPNHGVVLVAVSEGTCPKRPYKIGDNVVISWSAAASILLNDGDAADRL
jgi:putative spermidine/putrescine transport system ATP-binding protein